MTHDQGGFTLVELIITILVAGIFAISIFQLSAGVNNFAAVASREITASNLAYNNLRKYANGQKPLWFDCIGDDASESTAPFSDGKTHPDATGQVLYQNTATTVVNKMPPPVVETVVAIAPYGCGSSGPGMPIRIQSQVEYGTAAQKRTVTHATYVSY